MAKSFLLKTLIDFCLFLKRCFHVYFIGYCLKLIGSRFLYYFSATEPPRTPNPLFKRRFSLTPSATAITIISTSTPADGLTTTYFADGFDADDASDQVAKSSIHTSHFNQFIQNDAADNGELVVQRALTSGIKGTSLKSKANIGTATTHSPLEPNPPYVESITRRMGTVAATTEFTAAKRK